GEGGVGVRGWGAAGGYEGGARRLAVHDRMIAALQALPGVQSATTLSAPPLSGSTQVNSLAPDGSTAPRSEQPAANYRFVGPDFFRTLGITIVRGRSFTGSEGRTSGTMPALVSGQTARRSWAGEAAG